MVLERCFCNSFGISSLSIIRLTLLLIDKTINNKLVAKHFTLRNFTLKNDLEIDKHCNLTKLGMSESLMHSSNWRYFPLKSKLNTLIKRCTIVS